LTNNCFEEQQLWGIASGNKFGKEIYLGGAALGSNFGKEEELCAVISTRSFEKP